LAAPSFRSSASKRGLSDLNTDDAVPMGQVDIRGRANPVQVYQLA
jgi:hypothetical protein